MREKKKFPALPLGLKSEVLETRMIISPILKRFYGIDIDTGTPGTTSIGTRLDLLVVLR